MFPGDSSKWKVEAFLEVKKKYDESVSFLNIQCFILNFKDYYKYNLSWRFSYRT